MSAAEFRQPIIQSRRKAAGCMKCSSGHLAFVHPPRATSSVGADSHRRHSKHGEREQEV